jgi:hypothetical protein
MPRNIARLFALAVPCVAFVVAAPSAHASSSRLCVPVRAVGVGQDNGVNDQGQLTTTGTVLVGGVEVATSQATFTPGTQSATVLPFSGPIVLSSEIDASTLTAEVDGSVDLSTGKFTARSTSLTGAGALSGVSGHLRFTGRENLGTGAFRENISGRLCATL